MVRVAVVQRPPTLLNRAQTLKDAVGAIRESAAAGAQLIVLPEAFVPGYPIWIWRLRPAGDMPLSEKLYAQLFENAVNLDSDDLAELHNVAAECKVTVVCGVTERDAAYSRGTLYNSVVVIGPDGKLLNRHRKLMPTNPERMLWGAGDASGLRVIDTPIGRLGVLICWENYMPLARYALYAQGVEIYVAPSYDCGDRWVATARHIAREGGCWVVGCGMALRASDIPDSLPGKSEMYKNPDEWVNQGDSLVVEPGGKIVAGPMREEVGVLYADLDLKQVAIAKRSLDVAGHYSRTDIFQLHVNSQSFKAVD